MNNPWFRLYAEFAYDPKVQCLSETLQRRYIMLLCVTCNGEVKKMTDTELAFTLRISLDDLQTTLAELREHRLIGDDKMPLAWSKRQYKSDTSNDRVKKHREMKRYTPVTVTKLKRRVTPPDTDTDTDNISPISPLFDEFWQVFPKNRIGNRLKAETAWRRSAMRATPEEILAGATAYAVSDEVARGFAKGAEAWLNDDRWKVSYAPDDPVCSRNPAGRGFD